MPNQYLKISRALVGVAVNGINIGMDGVRFNFRAGQIEFKAQR